MSGMLECKGCGAAFPEVERKCLYCGTRLKPATAEELRREAEEERERKYSRWQRAWESFRDEQEAKDKPSRGRGTRKRETASPEPLRMFRQGAKKNRGIAFSLAFLFGMFGVHWFYMGARRRGWLYLAFCWTGVPFILALIDAVRFLCVRDEVFDGRFG